MTDVKARVTNEELFDESVLYHGYLEAARLATLKKSGDITSEEAATALVEKIASFGIEHDVAGKLAVKCGLVMLFLGPDPEKVTGVPQEVKDYKFDSQTVH